MKEVTIELHNIQSHEHTRFTLKPGINFIISPDNNVGKSTIFSVLNALVEVRLAGPNAIYLNNLLRVNTDNGYAMFLFDDVQVIFWLLRRDASHVNFLFQTTIDGKTAQSADPPQVLLDALDLHANPATKMMHNILEADKVQLIVDEGKQCDEIISSVLIDESVEKAKENMSILYSRAQDDKKSNVRRLGYINDNLSAIQYNHTVDGFFEELPVLEVLDDLLSAGIPDYVEQPNIPEFPQMKAALEVFNLLSPIEVPAQDTSSSIDEDEVGRSRIALEVMRLLEPVNIPPKSNLTKDSIKPLEKVLEAYTNLYKAQRTIDTAKYINREVSIDEYEYNRLLEDIMSNNKVVMCPERGKVIYCGKECIPIGDRPAL